MSIVTHPRNPDFFLVTFDKLMHSPATKTGFSKASRFPKINTHHAPLGCSKPSSLTQRATSIGYGKKFEFSGKED